MTTVRILFTIVFTILFLVIISFLDFKVLTPLLPLSDDVCFYHTHIPPTWVNLLYLDSSEHVEAPYNLLHMALLGIVSMALGIVFATKAERFLKRKEG